MRITRLLNNKMLIISLIILSGLALRVYKLGSYSFFCDEISSIFVSNNLQYVKYDFHPCLYFILLRIWETIFGSGEFSIRLLSVIPGVLSIYFVFKLGEVLFNKRIAIISSIMLAVSAPHIFYSQFARPYIFSALFTIVSLYFLMLSLKNNKNINWAIFSIFSVIGLYTEHFYFLVLISILPVFIYRENRIFLKKWIIVISLILLSYIPAFVIFSGSQFIRIIKNGFWLKQPGLFDLRILFDFFNFEYEYHPSSFIYSFLKVLFILLIICSIYFLRKEKKKLILISCILFLPIALVFLISYITTPIFIERKFLILVPIYYIFIARGIDGIKNTVVKTTALLIIALIAFTSLISYYSIIQPSWKRDFRSVANYVKTNMKSGDIIVHAVPWSVLPFSYYCRPKNIDWYSLVFIDSDKSVIAYHNSYRKSYIVNRVQDISKEVRFNRLWLIAGNFWIGQYGTLDGNSVNIKNWIERSASLQTTKIIDGVFVELYSRKAD